MTCSRRWPTSRLGQARFSPHTDEDGITLVMARKDNGGLEIRRPHTPENDWRPVCIPPGVVFIQPRDLLARWTNRVIHANEHRVMYPHGAGALIPRRQSIIFYLDPARETTVTPAPSCAARTSEVLPPLHVGEYIMKARKFTLPGISRHGWGTPRAEGSNPRHYPQSGPARTLPDRGYRRVCVSVIRCIRFGGGHGWRGAC